MKYDKIPNRPGVYIISNPDGEVLYIGTSENMRRRVKDHVLSNDPSIQVKCIKRSKDRKKIEKQMISEYSPRYNSMGVINQEHSLVESEDIDSVNFEAKIIGQHDRAITFPSSIAKDLNIFVGDIVELMVDDNLAVETIVNAGGGRVKAGNTLLRINFKKDWFLYYGFDDKEYVDVSLVGVDRRS